VVKASRVKTRGTSRRDEHVILAHSLDDLSRAFRTRLDYEHIAGIELDGLATVRREDARARLPETGVPGHGASTATSIRQPRL
jgi:hypothetical protein